MTQDFTPVGRGSASTRVQRTPSVASRRTFQGASRLARWVSTPRRTRVSRLRGRRARGAHRRAPRTRRLERPPAHAAPAHRKLALETVEALFADHGSTARARCRRDVLREARERACPTWCTASSGSWLSRPCSPSTETRCRSGRRLPRPRLGHREASVLRRRARAVGLSRRRRRRDPARAARVGDGGQGAVRRGGEAEAGRRGRPTRECLLGDFLSAEHSKEDDEEADETRDAIGARGRARISCWSTRAVSGTRSSSASRENARVEEGALVVTLRRSLVDVRAEREGEGNKKQRDAPEVWRLLESAGGHSWARRRARARKSPSSTSDSRTTTCVLKTCLKT